MKTVDLHGWKVADAEKLFMEELNRSRMTDTLIEVMLITGSGVIKDKLLALAKEHDLHHYVPMNNRGCLVIEFE